MTETMTEEKRKGPGRPRNAPEDLRRPVSLKLSPREHEIAKTKADKAGLNFSDYVRSRIL